MYIRFIEALRPEVRKRGHDLRAVVADEIAFRMGFLCKRVIASDPGTRKQTVVYRRANHRSRSPEERRRCADSRSKGKDATYWNDMATSLSSDVARLRDALSTREREYSSLFELNSKLVQSYKDLERKMIEAERELTYLRNDPFQETGGGLYHRSVVSSIPINTLGRDAMYWHQMCRTMQAQYFQAKGELDEKTHLFLQLSNRIKELESIVNQRNEIL